MKNAKNRIVVTLHVGKKSKKSKVQPWTFSIDMPRKKGITNGQFYSRPWTAKRGALRMISAEKMDVKIRGAIQIVKG